MEEIKTRDEDVDVDRPLLVPFHIVFCEACGLGIAKAAQDDPAECDRCRAEPDGVQA